MTTASHNSGIITDMDCFDILNVYIRLVKDSPLAKYLSIKAN